MSVILNPGGGTGGGGGNIVDSLEATLQAGNTTGAASGILVNDGDKIAMASGALITFSSNANPGGLPDVLIQRSGVRTVAINQPGGGGATLDVGPGGIVALGQATTDISFSKGGTASLNIRDGTASSPATVNAAGINAFNGSTLKLSINGGNQLFALSSDSSILFRNATSLVSGANELSLARSGVSLLGISNNITSAPATGHLNAVILGPLSASGSRIANDNNGVALVQNALGVMGDLKVQNITILGTQTGGSAGASSTIFATGLVVGDHSASGSKIVSDANGRLIVQNGNSALGPIFASELKFGHPTITAQQYLLKNSSLSNGGAMLVDITSTTQQYLTVLGVYGANQEEFFLGTNGLDIQGNADIRWNSNSNDILSNFDLQVSRSGVGLIAINNPTTEAPATGHLNAIVLGPLSASGSRLANDNNGTLLVQNGVGVMGDLKVQNLTILGNQTGGASSAVITPVFSTGIVIGAHSASGSKLVSDSNGLLLVQQADTLGFGGINVGPSGKIAWGYDAFDGSAAIFYEGNGTLSVRNIGNTSPGYMRALEFQAVQGNTVRAQISANNGITLTSPYRLAFNSSSTDITVAPDTSIARSGVGLLALYNPIISEPANFMSKNNGTMIQSSGAISGSLQIDMQGAKVQTFSVSTTGSFAAYNMLGHMSYEKYLYMTAVGTVGLSFDTNWKWLGAKPTSIASGNTYLITLNNYGATSSDVLASYAVLGPGT